MHLQFKILAGMAAAFLTLSGVRADSPSVDGLPPSAWPAGLTSEADVQSNSASIRGFYDQGVQGTLASWDGLTLHYVKFELPDERAAVVIVPGRGESKLKYAELSYNLVAEGYSVYVPDLRSQGQSSRITSDLHKVHVQRFQDYATDLQQFVSQVVRAVPHRRVYGLAHSMGGLVTFKAAVEGIHLFDALVLSSPFLDTVLEPSAFGVKVPLTHWDAYKVMSVLGRLYGWDAYAPTQKDPAPIDFTPGEDGFAQDKMTHSHIRYIAKLENYLDPENGVENGGSTLLWLWGALRASDDLPATLPHLSTRTLLMEAGQDVLAIPAAEDKACALLPHCQLVKFPSAYHELYQESDSVRVPVVLRTLAHFINPYQDDSAEGLTVDELNFQLEQLDWLLAHDNRVEATYAAERLNWLYAKFSSTVPGWNTPEMAAKVQAGLAKVAAATVELSAGESQLLDYFRAL